jgi:hypothetical protein
MKQSLIFLISTLALLTTACKKDKPSNNRQIDSSEATLAWQECVDFSDANLTICFVEASEYRCACNTECVWAGAVDVTLKIQGDNFDHTRVLTLGIEGKQSVSVGGHTITLLKAEPQDICTQYGQYDQYKAQISVE